MCWKMLANMKLNLISILRYLNLKRSSLQPPRPAHIIVLDATLIGIIESNCSGSLVHGSSRFTKWKLLRVNVSTNDILTGTKIELCTEDCVSYASDQTNL